MEVTIKYLLIPLKEVFETLDAVVDTHEVICGSSKYQDILGGSFPWIVKSMVYDILDKT